MLGFPTADVKHENLFFKLFSLKQRMRLAAGAGGLAWPEGMVAVTVGPGVSASRALNKSPVGERLSGASAVAGCDASCCTPERSGLSRQPLPPKGLLAFFWDVW